METDLERLQREVFSVGTEAGYKLRYHITRALACPDYAKEINFIPEGAKYRLLGLFTWKDTLEGVHYWESISYFLELKRRHDSDR